MQYDEMRSIFLLLHVYTCTSMWQYSRTALYRTHVCYSAKIIHVMYMPQKSLSKTFCQNYVHMLFPLKFQEFQNHLEILHIHVILNISITQPLENFSAFDEILYLQTSTRFWKSIILPRICINGLLRVNWI